VPTKPSARSEVRLVGDPPSGEAVEAAAAIEIAVVCGTARQADADRVAIITDRLVAMLTRLMR